jgi:Mn-dependent DtxR family transcriptional regulator
MSLHESAEMYLETIYTLSQKSHSVRSIDVAEALRFSRPSVSRAVGLLKKDGYLLMDGNGFLTLTDSGKSIAEKIFERHTVLTNVLLSLGVDAKTAAEDACKIEHVISDNTFEHLKAFIQKETE